MKDKLLIVDGMNLNFQMFCGMPARIIGRHGKAVHGTLGFVGALIKMINMIEPSHLAVLFDGEHPLARSELYPEYKANRPVFVDIPEDESPFSQLGDIYACLDFMKIRHTEIDDVESDDVIAAYAIKLCGEMEVVIASFDSDFFQLINKTTSVLRYRGKSTIIWDENIFYEKFGIYPYQYADFKALTGDSSDNIKGVEYIGPKTAAQLLNDFDNLHSIILNCENIKRQKIRQSIKDYEERLLLNLKLIALNGNAPLPFGKDALNYMYDGKTTMEVLRCLGFM